MDTNLEESKNEVLLSVEEYISRAIPEIKKLADQFYRGEAQSSWSVFEQLLEGIGWIETSIDHLQRLNLQSEDWLAFCAGFSEILNILPILEDAMKQSDHTLIADILNYEIVPGFEKMAVAIHAVVDNEVNRHDVN